MKLTVSLLATILAASAAPEAVVARSIGNDVATTAVAGRNLLTNFRPNNGDEGNEGNEGNEGDEGNEGYSTDALGDQITKHYISPGHPNDGNEGNEGNEGRRSSSPPSTPSRSRSPPAGKYDALGDEITKHYIRPGHPNDGNEGNEGNEGRSRRSPSPRKASPSPSPSRRPAPSGKYDSRGDEITKHYIRPGHPNDGNEGNEGNEGRGSSQALRKRAPAPAPRKPSPAPAPRKQAPAPAPRKPSPPPSPKPSRSPPAAKSNGKHTVCVKGAYADFGRVNHRRPEGIRVYSDGRCELMEYAGGFDGYWSVDAGDGHEDEFARAVKLMLRDSGAKIGKSAKPNNPANKKVNAFMKELRDTAKPTDWDYPRDLKIADGGGRMRNIRKASAICTKMIEVKRC